MHAFRAASLIDADSIVKHDASYQFTILCYEHTNILYDPIQTLTAFINQYPESVHLDEIYTCLANTYLNTSNYDDAISVLEKSEFKNNCLDSEKLFAIQTIVFKTMEIL